MEDDSANIVPPAPLPNTTSLANLGISTTVQEHRMPMLEVHPSQSAIHTWRDFVIHIATIVIGLLIAIGLEQSVEYLHHRHQLEGARRELSKEIDDNQRTIQMNIESSRKSSLALDANIALLRAQRSSNTPVAMKLDYTWDPNDTQDGAWQAAKQSGSLSLMPHDELRRYARVYAVLAAFMEELPAFGARMEVAGAIARRSVDGNLSSRDIEELMSATSEVQGRLALLIRLLRYAKHDMQDVSHE
jgi:hypothetical protein